MIRRGKAVGWLTLPSEALLPWAMLNEVSFDRTVPGTAVGRGGALLAKDSLNATQDENQVLLTVPRDLILSRERVKEHTKIDKDFREVFESLGNFAMTARGAILTFLLFQASLSFPDLSNQVGVRTAFSDYVKSLPLEPLPTFWTVGELQLLVGTTLAPAIGAKLRSLRREYDTLCSSIADTRWYQLVEQHLDFDDWLQVDAMYRSRALDFPNIGHCMVPCVDLANHAAGQITAAIYEQDANGNAILLLRDEKQVQQGEEVTITYGDEKGACEMIFSYGFLDHDMDSAASVFLSLDIPVEDVSRSAKVAIADCAPGFRIIDSGHDDIEWTGDFVWLLCVNPDDGLHFELARTVDGHDEQVSGLFKDVEIVGGAAQLYDLLAADELWDVYHLRAVTIQQQRIFDQLSVLHDTQREVQGSPYGANTDISIEVFNLAMKLRELEFALLEKAYGWFEAKKLELVESSVVTRYLTRMNETGPADTRSVPEDFS